MERRGILARVQVHQAEVVRDDPLEWVEVERPLQTSNRRYVSARRAEPRRISARQRRAPQLATHRCLPKKHIPMLFQSCAELGVCTAATRYLTSATSMSEWSCARARARARRERHGRTFGTPLSSALG